MLDLDLLLAVASPFLGKSMVDINVKVQVDVSSGGFGRGGRTKADCSSA